MSAASVLRSFGPSAMPGPVMPMDVALRFYHSPPPLRGLLSSYEELHRAAACNLYKPLKPCLSSQPKAPEDGGAGAFGWSHSKKRVVFADTKGMSLTAIHVFSKFDDKPYPNKGHGGSEDLQFDMTDLEAATMDTKTGPARSLALDFKQPSADYLDFRNRLMQNSVCLENCSLQQRSLTGTIKVRNIGFEKSVALRVTFDSWASFSDVGCTFMNNVYSCQDTDTFAFALELPAHVPPQNRAEFCICFRVRDQVYWDNNDSKNYTLRHTGWAGPQRPEQKRAPEHRSGGREALEMEFDQFGSPRMSSGLFPGWQSWGQIENAVPYW
ncbi:protein phosphatase 1, regulatory subunit 3Ca [Brachionichthys hirsutus]|uniref:protein phosphatase 1, regulatory subunit 3Ca n=1 Tax=Brachionichthys hirsutus TaxID=412623 RepID=UPI00360487A3